MPDLTPQAPSNVTAQAPTSSVSPQQVASPFLELAKALDQSGDALTGVATNLAEQAGFKAVTRDDQGNIQVEKAPIIGPASAAYARAVKMAALAAGEGDAKRADIALRQQYRDDPTGYLAASDAFKTDTQALYTKQAGPEVGIAVGRAIDATTTQTYRGLLNESERLNLQRADRAITAQIQSSRDDAVALARGGDTESEAFQKAVQTVHTLTNERVNNPRLAYPPAQAAYDLQHFDGAMQANGFLYHVDQVYKDKGVADDGSAKGGAGPALEFAKSILTDPSLKLTENERQHYYAKATGEIHANEAIRKQDVNEARLAEVELGQQARVEPEDVESVAQAYRAAGDPAGAARLYAKFSRKPLNDDFGRQPLAVQTQQVNDLQGNARQKGAYDFFVGKGWSPEQAAGIVGGLRGETANLNPTQSHDGGIGIGISGWNADRRAALTDFARANKLNPFELNTQLEFVDYELKHNESAAGAALKNATTPEQAGNAMLGYFRPKDFDVPGAHPERAQYSRQAYDAFGPNGTGAVAYSTAGGATPPNPASTLWLQANRERTLNVNAQAAWKTVMQDYETKGIRPAPAIVDQIVDAARATNNHALLEGIAAGSDRMNLVQEQGAAPLPAQHAAVTALEAAGQAGQLSPGQHAILKDLQAKSAAITTGLKDNPIQTAIVNFPERFRTPAPLDVTDQNALVGGLKQRAQIAQFAASNWQTGPLSALDASDLTAVKAAASSPDLATKTRVFSAIAQLPDDVRNATLKKLTEKGGPEMAVSAAAGALLPSAPDVAQSILRGQDALKTDKAYWPTAQGELPAVTEKLDKGLPASTFSFAARTDPSGPFEVTRGMVKARYADLSAQIGDTSGKLNAGRLQTAIDDVTGGVLNHNGSPLIAPQRGMSQSDLDRTLAGLTDADLSGVSTLNGQPVTADYVRNSAQLESAGQGRYRLRLGTDPLKPIYAFVGANSEMPQPFVLDLRNRPKGQLWPDALTVGAAQLGMIQ